MNSRLKLTLLSLYLLLIFTDGSAQINTELYAKADSARQFSKLVYNGNVSPHWLDSTQVFWYDVDTKRGKEYFLVDAARLKKTPAFDLVKLTESLTREIRENYKPFALDIRNLEFNKGINEISFELDKVKWKCNIKTYKLTKEEDIEEREPRRYWGAGRDELSNKPITSPDGKWIAFIEGYNLFIKKPDGKEKTQLSFDGNETEFYSSFFEWAPDSKKIAAYKITKRAEHIVYFVESSPKDQLQPKLHEREYLKPGDVVPVRKPALFDVENRNQIPVDATPYLDQYSLRDPQWRKDSRAFTFEYNQRGHQIYQVVEVNATTGATRTIIDERSKTFIDYSGKTFRYDVNDGAEIVWSSERDGWRHLYLFDGNSGKIKNQITKGEWVIRDVVHVDEASRQILFAASGRNEGEDPYFIHYYRINFDGSGLVDLTPEKANHDADFSDDYKYFVDRYSRVDLAPVAVLRRTSDGKVMLKLEEADISDLLKTGWSYPEVFVAKGRDGKTDIWGNIYRPSNFDPNKKYPVIEYIYAGPHNSFAQKSFRAYSGAFTGLCEMGFIIVQLDGMGTSNRSKAFHDVCWKNLRDAGFPDRILWIKAAAAKHSYMDISKMGIFGVSAGGQSSLAGMLWHGDFYKVCVSSCGCHDNRMDKIWWNEQWMGYPIGPQYAENSNVVSADKLQGDLMLIVGEVDDNVDPASTMQVADALIKADKEFELVVIPGANHTLGGEYGERKRRDFFVKHILNDTPPAWNEIVSKTKK